MPATRLQIKNALQNPYDRILFAKEVLKPVFGSGFNLLNTMIEATEKPNLSESKVIDQVKIYANIKLEDGTEITCYEIVLQPTVRIERSKVIIQRYIRKLLTTGQGALVNFITPVDNNAWRLTLIAKDSVITDDSIEEKYTNAKRYTYLVGPSENCRTVAERLEILSIEKNLDFDAVINAFSVEKLNKAFYKDITAQFYQLIGATIGKGKSTKIYTRTLQLPGINNENNRAYQEFAVRLIGRTVFCWFLKVKKSEAGIALLPEHLLSSESVKQNPNYYHNILERLFFQTLNTPVERRLGGLPKGCEYIPFLNGGLFEAQIDDYYKFSESTNLSINYDSLIIPDEWFIDFFEKLEQYNFTIDENSVSDVEVSVDPEMLGSIFENLLAEIDPDSGETARKATGSFYTPREIVDYMATQSLVCYLNNETGITKGRVEAIFKIESELDFSLTEEEKILLALDKLKILDPACGSGAFPMGILQKIVLALQKIDYNAEWWINRQVSKNNNPIGKTRLLEKLRKNPDYARKIGIIQNSLYGVDIQPIAAEISKLRCFLTLIVDEHINESKPNRGIEPLPNLEFKFVTADTLLKLPDETTQVPIYNAKRKKNPLELLTEIQQVRLDYLESFGDRKQNLKEKFHQLQKEIFDQQGFFGEVENNRAFKIANWHPFSHEKTDWFDPEWMFGIKSFDIVIGNPPYGAKVNKEQISAFKQTYQLKTSETAILFIERGFTLTDKNGILTYIIPKSFSFASNYQATRQFLQPTLAILSDCGKAFEEVKLEACVTLINKKQTSSSYVSTKFTDKKSFKTMCLVEKSIADIFGFFPNGILEDEIKLGLKILSGKKMLNEIAQNNRGDMLQSNLQEIGSIKVIGGKEFSRYMIKGIKGYLSSNESLTAKSVIAENSVIVQNIVAHLTKPIDHIKIIAYVPSEKNLRIADTVNQLTISDDSKYSKYYVWSLLNSKLIGWYVYRFIFGKAIRTMHFDNVVTCRIPIMQPPIDALNQINEISNRLLNDKNSGTQDVETQLDEIIFKIYGLNIEEIKLINKAS